MSIQVTLIGGPLDLQRRVLAAPCRMYQVPETPEMQFHPWTGDDPIELVCKVHTYYIQPAGRDVYVGIHEGLMR